MAIASQQAFWRYAEMHWKIKAAAFRVLDVLPLGSAVHFAIQRHVTKAWPRPSIALDALIGRARMFVDEFTAIDAQPLSASTFLEVGSGRDLCVPLALRALGVRKVVTTDISRLAKIDLVNHAAAHVAKTFGLDTMQFENFNDLAAYGVEYRAPMDVRDVTGPVDAIVSNEVLEHIEHDVLRSILAASVGQLRDGGLSIHTIDYSDHFARGSTVSRHNFLSYSDDEWRRFNSSFQFVNRLRHGDYLKAFEGAGFEILRHEPRHMEIPMGLRIAPQFRRPDASIVGAKIIAKLTSTHPE